MPRVGSGGIGGGILQPCAMFERRGAGVEVWALARLGPSDSRIAHLVSLSRFHLPVALHVKSILLGGSNPLPPPGPPPPP